MRLIHYAVYDKKNEKRIYVHCKESECRKFLEQQDNKEDLIICYKWVSI